MRLPRARITDFPRRRSLAATSPQDPSFLRFARVSFLDISDNSVRRLLVIACRKKKRVENANAHVSVCRIASLDIVLATLNLIRVDTRTLLFPRISGRKRRV